MNSIAQKPESYRAISRFWLDIIKDEESKLACYITELKAARSFASPIRDALRLIYDLRQGKLDVLLLLFPWVYNALREQIKSELAEEYQSSCMDPEIIIEEISQRLEKRMMLLGSSPQQSFKSLPEPPTMPDDTQLIEVKKAESNASLNLMNSFRKVQGLPPLQAQSSPQSGKPKQLTGANIQFAALTFDDEDI